MTDPDSDAEAERRTDPRFDAWPVERATPRGGGEPLGEVPETHRERRGPEDVKWLGFAGRGSSVYGPFLYDAEGSAVYEGDVDHEADRIVLDEESRRDVDDDRSLGEHLEAVGDEHGWTWLSSFAREHLEDDPDRGEPARADPDREAAARGDAAGAPASLELRDSEFVQRNLPESSDLDVGFTGSHTLVDESGRVHVVDRFFDVVETGPGRAAVRLEEEFLLAAEPEPHRREGDAELVEEREYGFDVEFDEDAPNVAAAIESELRTWHAAHVGWPTGA